MSVHQSTEPADPALYCANTACESAALGAVLDRFGPACFVVDARCAIRTSNLAGRELIERVAGPLRLHSGQLSCREPADTRMLLRKVVEACAPRAANDQIVLRLRAGEATTGVLVAPACEGRAMVIALDANALPRLDTELLRAHLGLTQAEAMIMLRLADGHSVAAIAQARGAALETVRSQIKVVLTKLGVRSQLQAIVVILRSLAAMRGAA